MFINQVMVARDFKTNVFDIKEMSPKKRRRAESSTNMNDESNSLAENETPIKQARRKSKLEEKKKK